METLEARGRAIFTTFLAAVFLAACQGTPSPVVPAPTAERNIPAEQAPAPMQALLAGLKLRVRHVLSTDPMCDLIAGTPATVDLGPGYGIAYLQSNAAGSIVYQTTPASNGNYVRLSLGVSSSGTYYLVSFWDASVGAFFSVYDGFCDATPTPSPSPVPAQGSIALTISPTALSPNGDGIQDTTGISITSTPSSSNWSLYVDGESSAIASGVGSTASGTPVIWDGTIGGQKLPDGQYTLLGKQTGAADASATVIIDTQSPHIETTGLAYLPEHTSGAKNTGNVYFVTVPAKIVDRGLSGIDPSTVLMSIPGASVSNVQKSFDSSTGIFSYSANVTLPRSQHGVSAIIYASDKAGNSAQVEVSSNKPSSSFLRGGGGGNFILGIVAVAEDWALEYGLQTQLDALGAAAFVNAVRASFAIQAILSDAVPQSYVSKSGDALIYDASGGGYAAATNDLKLIADAVPGSKIRPVLENYKTELAFKEIFVLPNKLGTVVARSLSSGGSGPGANGPATLDIQLSENPLIREIMDAIGIPTLKKAIKVRYPSSI